MSNVVSLSIGRLPMVSSILLHCSSSVGFDPTVRSAVDKKFIAWVALVVGRGTWVTLRGSWVNLRRSWVLFTDNFA